MILTLVKKQSEKGNVVTFRFQPEQPLSWQAGQFMQYTLPHDNPDKEGIKRWFTIASAPYEGEAQITTRITQSTFKQALNKLEIGDTIEASSPEGDFVWRESNNKPLVWIAGGIGITPFHSILKQRAHENQPCPVRLLYANRTEDVVFKEELDELARADSSLEIYYPTGKQLNTELINGTLGEVNDSLVYVSGPEPMVEALGDALKAEGLPEAELVQDFFPGYTEANF